MPIDCLACHTFAAWRPVRIDHGRTRFPLRGRHAQVACQQCHPEGRFGGLAFAGCGDCHADAHDGQFAQDCRHCHSEGGWKPAAVNHARARFRLTGRHAALACERCHRLERPGSARAPFRRYRPLAFADCSDCHRDPHRPSLGADCQRCHAVAGWKETRSGFDHGQTRFLLRGRHAQAACEGCHAGGRLRDLAFGACGDCHRDVHQGQLAQDCGQCHVESGWSPSSFDHARARLVLDGRHAAVRCDQCHPLEAAADGATLRRYRPLGQTCPACHRDVHQGQLAPDCSQCHSPSGWRPSSFDHARARFAVEGKHVGVPCEGCHGLETAPDGSTIRRYRPLATRCAACHG
ncbi:MAG: hypothetical protein AB1505_02575 [Candidatus Latescibacterota bacterium]